jgi:molecular chaperone Hsp33
VSHKETEMTATDIPHGDDQVLPFQLDRLDLRGRVARLDATLDRILGQHAYPASVGALVGEATLLATLIGQAMKLRGRFSLQARGDGPVSLIAADYVAPAEAGEPALLRAYAQFDRDATPEQSENPAALLGEGLFAMTIDQGTHMQPYQGVTPLTGGGLGMAAEIYFAQSEQIATKFTLAIGRATAPGDPVERWRAGGVMIQHLPPAGEHVSGGSGSGSDSGPGHADGLMRADDIAELGDHADAWREASLLLNTAEPMELIGPYVTPEQLLLRLFHENQPRVFPVARVRFGCGCGPHKVETLLATYPRETLAEMVEEDGAIHADCQFCGQRYSFTLDALSPADAAS